MSTINNSPTDLENPFQSALQTKITRRSFLKRTAATILVTVMAVNAFAEEPAAKNGGESSEYNYILKMVGWGSPMIEVNKQGSQDIDYNDVAQYGLTMKPEMREGSTTEPEWLRQAMAVTNLPFRPGDGVTKNGAPVADYSGWLGIKSRVLDSYTQIPHPLKKGDKVEDYDYYNTNFPFKWDIRAFGVALPFTDPPAEMDPKKEVLLSYYSGSAALEDITKPDVTKTMPDVTTVNVYWLCSEHLTAAGAPLTFKVEYTIEGKLASETKEDSDAECKWEIKWKIWKPVASVRNTTTGEWGIQAPPAGEPPALQGGSLSDSFHYYVEKYEVP